MKKKFWLLVPILLVMLLIVGVVRANANPQPSSGGPVFLVEPSGGDDTTNLQAAFELAKVAGPGATVQLAPGEFTVQMMLIENFDGYFKGSGEAETIVGTFADQKCQPLIDEGRYPAVFMFEGGYPRISDMTIHIQPIPCEPFHVPAGGEGFIVTFISGIMINPGPIDLETDCFSLATDPLSAAVERVTISGRWDWGDEWYHLWVGLGVSGSIPTQDLWAIDCPYHFTFAKGEFLIRQVTVRDGFFGILVSNTAESNVTLDSNQTWWNDLGFLIRDSSGNNVEFAFNQAVSGLGVDIHNGQANPVPYISLPSHYNIHHNDTCGGGDCIYLHDYNNVDGNYERQGPTIFANYHHNSLHMLDGSWGVWGEFLESVSVHQNVFDGETPGIPMLFGLAGETFNGNIFNNDLHNVGYSMDGPFKILLGPGTMKYKVVTDEEGSVLDIGTDNTVNERPRRGQWGYTEEFTAQYYQTMKKVNDLMLWGSAPLDIQLLPPVNILYLPFMGR